MASARYVALLRGINVGGNNVIPMAALAAAFEAMRFTEVRTYIASGNVIFATRAADPRALERKIERGLAAELGYAGKLVVRSADQLAAVIRDLPRGWQRPSRARRYNVIFLRHAIDHPSIVDQLGARPGIEQVTYRPGVLYWSAQISTIARTAMVKLSSRPIYREMTVRNLNTTRKLAALVTG